MSVFTVNSFQVPNALVDAQMSSMSGNALKCLMYVIRKTRGWHKQEDAIAISAFVQKCGMSKNTAIASIKELVSLGLVKRVRGSASTALNNYSLTAVFDSGTTDSAGANIEPVQNLHGADSDSASANSAPTSANIELVASANFAPTKDILFKDTSQKTNTKDSAREAAKKSEKFDFATELKKLGVKGVVLDSWLAVRKAKKAANTVLALEALVREAAQAGLSVNDAVRHAAENSWSGFKAAWYANSSGSAQRASPASKHGGFENVDYGAGVAADGRF